ncbi:MULTISPECIES: hypothetical protein [unclassified Pseudomonas]|uniref:hypothetical protein n=1 Tax=unclassified Pseudomonas TaxID=196821 RepID=UPI0024495A85|nr:MULTISPECIES: hypothetical protein [unclassified Pseudomonas]MDH0303573.1 hypothetical protein [Pseudomonas sp. GD04091]MDH1987625.1 hypothetical protein [Pseudomonas sp. GD03689]
MSTLHTQASNFLDFMKTGVDNRTGQFTLALALPLPPANQLCGPALPVTLSFASLASNLDKGYGLGWSLGLSELYLDQDSTRLSLSSGERFAIDLDRSSFLVDSHLAFLDQKLDSLRLRQQADGSLRVEHASGHSEILRQQASSPWFVLEELRSPEGRRLYFDWLPFGDDGCRLEQVRDELRTLLSLDRREDEIRITFNPSSPQAATLRLVLSDGRLTQIHVPEIATPFQIDYTLAATLLLPSTLLSPMGAKDIIHWATGNEGHRLPVGAPFPYLPRVLSWTHTCGTAANELNRTYEWVGDSNFLGFGSDQAFAWDSGRDNLYQVDSEYHYQLIETLSDGAGRTLETITRTWNRFHLPILEASRRGDCETHTHTTYGIDPQLNWEQQPAACQLPHEVSLSYIDHARDGATRTQTTRYRYDPHGNLLQVIHPDGLQELSEFYPAQGAEGCPADPLGRVRHLKSSTVIPAPAKGEAPTLGTRYTYLALPSLIAGEPAHPVLASEEAFDVGDGRVLQRTEQHYITAPGPLHGRVARRVTTLGDKATTTAYRYEITADELVSETTCIGYEHDDENRASHSQGHSLLSGLTRWERSQTGACRRYRYDALGRIVQTLSAADSPWQTVRSARHHVDDAVARDARPDGSVNPVMLEQVDANGGRQRQWLDGDGRTVKVEQEDLDEAPGHFRVIARYAYDALGRQISRTSQDWLGPTTTTPLTLTTTTAYDDWGQACLDIGPDGIHSHSRHDPVTLRSEQWQEAGGLAGAKQVVLSDLTGQPIEHQDIDADGRLVRTRKRLRDGLGRVIEERIEVPGASAITTRLRHDHHGRLIEKQLVDGTRLAWTFAPHSDEQHLESISITPAQEQQP